MSRAPRLVWEGEAFTLDRTRSRGILALWGRGGFIAPAHAPAAVRLASGGEDVGMMSQPVQQGSGQFLISEDLDPFTEAQVGGHQSGAPLLAVGKQVE